MSGSNASVIHDQPKQVPLITAGNLTPEVLRDWRNACEDYFLAKEIDEKKQVIFAATGFKDPRVRAWYQAERARFVAITFANFASEVAKRWLSKDWEYDIKLKILNMRQRDNEPFAEWITKLENTNTLLINTPSYLDEAKIREEVEAKLCDELREVCRENDTKALQGYSTWRDALVTYDNKRLRSRERIIAYIGAHRAPSATTKQQSSSSATPVGTSAGPRKFPKRLTDEEKDLLRTHEGCFKCRKFYAGHTKYEGEGCPNDFPPANFPTLTKAAAEAAKAKHEGKGKKPMRRTVAAVDIEDDAAADHVVAAVRSGSPAAASSSVLECHSDEDDDSDSYVPKLFYPSLTWKAFIRSPSDLSFHPSNSSSSPRDVPAPESMLMDSGCTTVLIRRDLVKRLRLRERPLEKHIPMKDAWCRPKDATHWVKFRITTVCGSWTSKWTYGIVVDSLCSPLVLGTPFFIQNEIYPDPHGKTLIHKPSGCDLFTSPPAVSPPPLILPPKQRRLEAERKREAAARRNLNLHQRVLVELKELFEHHVDYLTSNNVIHNEVIQPTSSGDIDFYDKSDTSPFVSRVRTPKTVLSNGSARMRFTLGRLHLTNITQRFLPLDEEDDILGSTRGELAREFQTEREEADRLRTTIAAVKDAVVVLAWRERMEHEEKEMRKTYKDVFPDDIPHIDRLPTDIYHRFRLKDPEMVIAKRQYECPKKYREVWRNLLDEHLSQGRMRPSASPYASPAFLIPKSDPLAKPRWVNDYRALNDNTVPDRHPLPSINEILGDCGNGKIFGKLDMTNSFFQTRVHPDDVPYTAVTTPFGLYEWLVMPQGCRNAPATHQRRMFQALRHLIGTVCHVYLDDIIIWSQTIDEHRRNVTLVLDALRQHHLYASRKKTQLFADEVKFLGHRISARGIEADDSKVEKILNWPSPKSASDVRSFLGLVRYLDKFLPNLADFTRLLTPLTTKECDKDWPGWTSTHQSAFDSIKQLVVSRECLATIDHRDMGDNKIFVTTDASDWRTGAVLLYGPSLETARPVAYDSMQLKAAELNYPTHEKELLAIVRALKHWRTDLLGVSFTVYTDHKPLREFKTQKNLSRRQARWQELIGQYDFEIDYIPGEDNSPADSLSRLPPDDVRDDPVVGAVSSLRISTDPAWLKAIRAGYRKDP